MRIQQKGYGDSLKILAAYRKEIKEWPAVTAGDAAGFARFFNFFVKCKSLLVENKINNLINNPDIIYAGFYQNFQHIRKTGRIKKYIKSDEWKANYKEAELLDLIEMADEQTILISDPLFSREAVSQYVHKTDKFN